MTHGWWLAPPLLRGATSTAALIVLAMGATWVTGGQAMVLLVLRLTTRSAFGVEVGAVAWLSPELLLPGPLCVGRVVAAQRERPMQTMGCSFHAGGSAA
mmetsp:Transcript_93510/g.264032  ORF Transcript_93510/g.264032 Transcript_93510/m.264032 type:complete len:99 (-) Transcript_93510:497-793(-)